MSFLTNLLQAIPFILGYSAVVIALMVVSQPLSRLLAKRSNDKKERVITALMLGAIIAGLVFYFMTLSGKSQMFGYTGTFQMWGELGVALVIGGAFATLKYLLGFGVVSVHFFAGLAILTGFIAWALVFTLGGKFLIGLALLGAVAVWGTFRSGGSILTAENKRPEYEVQALFDQCARSAGFKDGEVQLWVRADHTIGAFATILFPLSPTMRKKAIFVNAGVFSENLSVEAVKALYYHELKHCKDHLGITTALALIKGPFWAVKSLVQGIFTLSTPRPPATGNQDAMLLAQVDPIYQYKLARYLRKRVSMDRWMGFIGFALAGVAGPYAILEGAYNRVQEEEADDYAAKKTSNKAVFELMETMLVKGGDGDNVGLIGSLFNVVAGGDHPTLFSRTVKFKKLADKDEGKVTGDDYDISRHIRQQSPFAGLSR